MVVYDDSEFKELINELLPASNQMVIAKKLLEIHNSKIHMIYKHINDLKKDIKKNFEMLEDKENIPTQEYEQGKSGIWRQS